MYKRISELESEHKNFRRKIGQLEFGTNANILVKTIPIEKQIDFYTKKSTNRRKIINKKQKKISFRYFYFLEQETLDEFFNNKPDLPLLSMNDYERVSSQINFSVIDNNKSLVDYSDSD
jgi:hypothetical protein